MLSNIEAVIFDLDGTLIDSMWLWREVDIEYLAKYNKTLPDDLQNQIEGMSFTDTVIYFKERFDIPDSVDKMKEDLNQMAWDYYTHRVPLKEGAKEFIDYLNDNNIPIGIGTSNSKELVEAVIEKHNIRHLFQSIRTSCEVQQGKPAPYIFLKVAEDLGVDPSRCLVFEDIPMGIMAGKSAGMKVCAIYDHYSKDITKEKLELADYYIETYNDILESKYEVLR